MNSASGGDWASLGGLAVPQMMAGPGGDIWRDTASYFTPTNMVDAFRLCEFLYLNFPAYRKGSERVVDYFLTSLKVSTADEGQRTKFLEILRDDTKTMSVLRKVGINYMCFHRDTPVITEGGVFRIEDLEGKTVNVLSEGGVYRSAKFSSYGTQELFEVEFRSGETILATAEHEWVVTTSTGKTKRVPTTELIGRSVPRNVATRPERGEEFRRAVCHGFTFGDGTLYNGGRQAKAYLFGDKDGALLEYFEGIGSTPKPDPERNLTHIHGLPAHWKRLPENEASAEYWYGFVCGFLAADGSVDTHGCPVLTQKSGATLEAIARQLPRIGMVCGPLRGYHRGPCSIDGRQICVDEPIHYLGLFKQFMVPEDFILPHHRSNFVENHRPTNYGKSAMVIGVRPTGIVEKVFCGEEMETHTLTIGSGLLTGNCYGNAVCTPHLPFIRSLACQTCHTTQNARQVKTPMVLNWTSGHIDVNCRKCNGVRPHSINDTSSFNPQGIKLICWDPKRILVELNEVTGEAQYWYTIPEYIKQEVRANNPFFLSTLPKSFLDTIRAGAKYKLDPDYVFHLKDSSIAGIDLRGWGPPSSLSAFRNFFRLQILMRQDEKLMIDYITPMRVVSPKQGGYVEGNSIMNNSMASFAQNFGTMIRQHRIGGMNWNVIPFPVDYQVLGGEGKQLSPADQINAEEDRLLNARGVPPEFYRASLTLQAAPVALRLFERSWSSLVEGTNELLQWWGNTISSFLRSGEFKVELDTVTVVDDIDNKIWRLQAMAGELLSKETALSPMGIDSKEEYRKLLEQQKFEARETEKATREMEMASLSLDSADGGESAEGSGAQGGGQTPGETMENAEAIARQLLAMPEADKNRQLSAIRETNKELHAMVKAKMQDIKNQARSIGQSAGLQAALEQPLPQEGGAPPPAAPPA